MDDNSFSTSTSNNEGKVELDESPMKMPALAGPKANSNSLTSHISMKNLSSDGMQVESDGSPTTMGSSSYCGIVKRFKSRKGEYFIMFYPKDPKDRTLCTHIKKSFSTVLAQIDSDPNGNEEHSDRFAVAGALPGAKDFNQFQHCESCELLKLLGLALPFFNNIGDGLGAKILKTISSLCNRCQTPRKVSSTDETLAILFECTARLQNMLVQDLDGDRANVAQYIIHSSHLYPTLRRDVSDANSV